MHSVIWFLCSVFITDVLLKATFSLKSWSGMSSERLLLLFNISVEYRTEKWPSTYPLSPQSLHRLSTKGGKGQVKKE